jgi:endonuclease III related protein
MSGSSSVKIKHLVRSLAGYFGEIAWWPGFPDEVMIGAILTQQTRWENVERALTELKKRGLCSLDTISMADSQDIEDAIRCTGFYRVKAKRLKLLASFVVETYRDIDRMADASTPHLRKGLLNVSGIGEETADSILCYGLFRTSFVIDAYTERMTQCIGVTEKRQDLKRLFEKCLPKDNYVYRQTHAHIVEYAKEFCGKKRCSECILVSSSG